MKFLALAIVFVCSFAWAQKNPLIRVCNLTGGNFHEIKMNEDQVAICQYGSALIDSLSVLDITSQYYTSQAATAALSSAVSCVDAGGESLAGEDLEGTSFQLCLFEDGSVIERSTLEKGSSDPANQGLVEALKTRF